MSETRIHQDDDLHGAHQATRPTLRHMPTAPACGGPAAWTQRMETTPRATPLGPIDWAAWGAGMLGIAAGPRIAICLFISTST